jgi:putative hydroxymethylpyrimidine transport system substrate-binding protein
MTRLLPILLIASALVLAACGTRSENTGSGPTRSLSLLLDFFPNADHAGIYEAAGDGEFRRAGLDVHIQPPGDASTPLKLLASGKVDLAISYEPEVLLARDKGAKLVSIAALVQRPLTSILALGSMHVHGPADLEGHTVGTAGIPYQSAYLQTILKQAGADPSKTKEVNVGFNLVPALLSKKVYAILGGYWNYEGIQLKRRHQNPTIIPVDQAGVPTYDELVIVAREDELGPKAAVFRRFLQALARATTALRANPAQGIDALMQANPDLDRGLQEASVKATMPAFFPADANRPWGWQDTGAWARFAKWMYDNRLLTQPATPQVVNNDLLPGQGF